VAVWRVGDVIHCAAGAAHASARERQQQWRTRPPAAACTPPRAHAQKAMRAAAHAALLRCTRWHHPARHAAQRRSGSCHSQPAAARTALRRVRHTSQSATAAR
jgi:hypothetical protein